MSEDDLFFSHAHSVTNQEKTRLMLFWYMAQTNGSSGNRK